MMEGRAWKSSFQLNKDQFLITFVAVRQPPLNNMYIMDCSGSSLFVEGLVNATDCKRGNQGELTSPGGNGQCNR
jgi:hypothetical protein